MAGSLPASIGPPEQKTAGMFARIAPRIMPGTILSQDGMQTIASNLWAATSVSTQSAMSSRDGSEYFMPVWAIARPSHTPMVSNSNGTPPASRMASATSLPTSRRWWWPGMISTNELQTATNGLPKSSFLRPSA